MQIDANATNFLKLAYSLSGSPTVISNYKITDVGSHFVPWDCEKVEELAKGTKISNHEWDSKTKKFEYFKKIFLENVRNEITLFAVRSSEKKPIMIIDGVHRAVGIYKSYLEKPHVENVTNIILVLFESQEIEKMQDYHKIIDNYNGI